MNLFYQHEMFRLVNGKLRMSIASYLYNDSALCPSLRTKHATIAAIIAFYCPSILNIMDMGTTRSNGCLAMTYIALILTLVKIKMHMYNAHNLNILGNLLTQ